MLNPSEVSITGIVGDAIVVEHDDDYRFIVRPRLTPRGKCIGVQCLELMQLNQLLAKYTCSNPRILDSRAELELMRPDITEEVFYSFWRALCEATEQHMKKAKSPMPEFVWASKILSAASAELENPVSTSNLSSLRRFFKTHT